MAKKKTEKAAQNKKNPTNGGESIAGYFRNLFRENPRLLKERSNDKLLQRWLADHPGEEVSPSVKNSLANLKSVLRSKKRQRRGKAVEEGTLSKAGQPMKSRAPARGLEELEIHIDESLTLARKLDPEGLEDIIALLRRARNQVVWKMGQ